MTDIQKARDVFAEWRETAKGFHRFPFPARGKPLIVGTAGNPDLLDAIGELLELEAEVEKRGGPVFANTKRIAAAIIAADERMQQ